MYQSYSGKDIRETRIRSSELLKCGKGIRVTQIVITELLDKHIRVIQGEDPRITQKRISELNR